MIRGGDNDKIHKMTWGGAGDRPYMEWYLKRPESGT